MTDNQLREDQLLQRLGAALAPSPVRSTPPASSVQDLHRVIDAVRSAGAPPARRRSPRALAAAAAGCLAAACVIVAVAVTSAPQIGRQITTRGTVAATSPAVGELTEWQRALQAALNDGDVSAVRGAAARLRLAIDELTLAEWIPVRTEIGDLLERADALLDGTPTTPPDAAPVVNQVPTSAAIQATSPSVPRPPSTATATSITAPDDDDDDNSGPGGGEDDDADDNSGPGGGNPSGGIPADDNSGPGSDDDNSGSG